MNDQPSRTVGDLSTEVFTKWWPGLGENDARVEIVRNTYNVNLALRIRATKYNNTLAWTS